MTTHKNNDRMQELAKKWQEGKITENEKLEFDQWYNSFDDSTIDISDETPTALKERLYQAIIERENIPNRTLIKSVVPWYRIAAAAIILMACSIGLYFYMEKEPVAHVQSTKLSLQAEIVPGSNKAILTLADGSTIVLDNAKNGVLANQGNSTVNKRNNGQLVYDLNGLPFSASESQLSYNTISTPLGGQYHVVLPDGSKVWLNAGSSLKFPTAFVGKERKVELTGEAYFEVAKNKTMPFILITNDVNVNVLGTHFNVMAYSDEKNTITTLLEGSVKVSKDSKNVTITPGHEANLNKATGNLQINPADMEAAIAWKNGYFMFTDESIQSIMRKVSRWYNVDIKYEGKITTEKFGGTISRFENASEILDMLALTGLVHFKIEERRITVMP